MSAPTTRLLYLGIAITTVVLLLAGVPVSTVLIVTLVTAMMAMHLGGHGGQVGRDASAEESGHPRAVASNAAQREP